MDEEIKVAVFKKLLDKFETEHMKLYCEDMIKTIPDYIFTMPSSTSGKYHNKTQCMPHGQIFHVLMFGTILNYRLELDLNKNKFKSPEQRDAMRCVPIFHDALKCGTDGSKWTVHEHPIFAAEWVRKTAVEHDIEDKVKEVIAKMCASHSGQWTTSTRSKVVLPEPSNSMEYMIHECDYLSSRNDIDFIIPEYLSDIFKDIQLEDTTEKVTLEEYKVSFPKHKGKTLIQIQKEDPDYIAWMMTKPDWREPIKSLLEQLKNNKAD